MRVTAKRGKFRAKAIAGTHVVLIALDCADSCREGLVGFAFKRERVGKAAADADWLHSRKVFKSIVPDPKNARDPKDPSKPMRFTTWDHPVQSLLWSDFTAEPDTPYRYTIVPRYGRPGSLTSRPALKFEVRTEKEFDHGHGVWFNRGAIASQAFSELFGNRAPSEEEINDPEARETVWLSRGLLEACLNFINETPAGDGLRVAAYEFTYRPILSALKAALDRGVDVKIVYHDTTDAPGEENRANEDAIAGGGLPKASQSGRVLYPRAQADKIPHNKFIVRLRNGVEPTMVWTGSTNFTPSGFLGQTNVGHLVEDAATARQFLAYWELLKKDPDRDAARAGAMKLTPNPPALIPPTSIVQLFSPRPSSDILRWYGARIEDAVGSVMFTAAFGVARTLVAPLARERDFLRFILMEKPPTRIVKKVLSKDRDCVIAYGAVLGEMYVFKNGKPTARRKIQEFELDKWLLKEDHYRHRGFVFFVHTKFLLIDPLSDDPLVCTGSANFSPASLLSNDENMLLIRGDTRVADIYLTEFDRIFRHFYFRDVANEIEERGHKAEGAFLDETDRWTDNYFRPGAFKTRRREMFFEDPSKSWVVNARKSGSSSPKKNRPVRARRSRRRRGVPRRRRKAGRGLASRRAT